MINSLGSTFDLPPVQEEIKNPEYILNKASTMVTMKEIIDESKKNDQTSQSLEQLNTKEIKEQIDTDKIKPSHNVDNNNKNSEKICPKEEKANGEKKDNQLSNSSNSEGKFQEQMKQQLSITDDIYMVINLTSQMTDEIKKDFDIIKDLPETPESELLFRRVNLKKAEKKFTNKTLVLDLDDTLVHTLSDKKVYSQKDLKNLEINSVSYIDPKKGLKAIAKYIIRPYALSFLQSIFPFYEIILFTASDQSYADSIIDKLDPDKTIIDYRLYRQHCITVKNKHIKNLNILTNRNMKDIIIVDNSIVSFKDNFDNGIHVSTFKGDSTDRELIKLCDLLKSKMMLNAEDVREIIKIEFPLSNMYKIYKKSLNELP